jgi:hypothetical protein
VGALGNNMIKKIGKRFAMVSEKNPKKVLKWYGRHKPSKIATKKREKQVTYFKNRDKYKKDHGMEAPF